MNQKENTYIGMRERAFETKPEHLGLSLPATKTIVYGIVMDWDIKNGTASIISFATGDASICFSSGSGITAEGTHENVKIVAIQFIVKAQQMLDKAIKTEQTPLPDQNKVVFYFLTNKGIYTAQDTMENFRNHTSIWLGLFLLGNEVINELRTKKDSVEPLFGN